MHLHSQRWKRPENFERHVWDFDTSLGDRPHWGRWRDGMGLDAAKEALFARAVDLIRRRLERFGKAPERFGLIHCDMRLANLLVDGDEVKVIDFDDCGFSWHLYDAATAVSFFEHEPHVPELMSAWVKGYRKVHDAPRRGRGGDPDLRHAPPHAPGRLDRLALGDRPRAVDGRRLHGEDGADVRGLSQRASADRSARCDEVYRRPG